VIKKRNTSVTTTSNRSQGGPPVYATASRDDFVQKTESTNTGWPLYLRGKRSVPSAKWQEFMSLQDWGSNFMTEKASMSSSLWRASHQDVANFLPYTVGWVGPTWFAGTTNPMALASDSEIQDEKLIMFGLGGTGINRAAPSKPGVDLAVALGELKKDGIPSALGSLIARSRTVKDVFRNGGNEYLNAQFGWVPLLKDIQALAQTAANSRALLEQHEREVGRLIRRRRLLEDKIDTVSLVGNTAAYELDPGVLSTTLVRTRANQGFPAQVVRRTVTKSYFSGGFRFYYPDYQGALAHLQEIEHQANLLLGTRLDPEVLWNLAPWTWLSDWFLNIGDIAGNISARIADDLVMQYGYVMRSVEISEDTSALLWWAKGNNGYIPGPSLHVHRDYHRKMRVKASPFGFGLNPDLDFTDHQWAILGALGISRGLK